MDISVVKSLTTMFKLSIFEAGTTIASLQDEANAVIRDDFYEAMGIATLASVPANTIQVNGWKNITIIQGPGAAVTFTRILFGAKAGPRAFASTCENVSSHFLGDYQEELPSEENSVTTTNIIETLHEVEKTTHVLSFLENTKSKIRVLLLPAKAKKNYKGTVYIHQQDKDDFKGYTLVLPQEIQGQTVTDVLQVFLSEMAVCISDIVLKEKEYSDFARNKHISLSSHTHIQVPPVRVCEKGKGERQASHLKKVMSAHGDIAKALIAQNASTNNQGSLKPAHITN